MNTQPQPQPQQELLAPVAPVEVTPELVRQVAQRVYAMLRREMRIEHERRLRPEPRGSHD